MNISRENLDDQNAIIQIGIEPIDYQPKVQEALLEYRKKARFDGFRPGKVPPSLVMKMYGKSILVEQINHLLSDTLNTYINENQLRILGEPLPNVNSPEIDWDSQGTFEFHFDIALLPIIELNFSENDKINNYQVMVTHEMVDNQIESYLRRFGSLKPTETISEEDVVKGDLCQVDESGNEHKHEQDEEGENHIHVHDAMIYIKTIGDETVKSQFMGSKAGDKLVFNPNIAFTNETDRASLLRVAKDKLPEINSDFELSISEISRFTPAEINQELFDKLFGEGVVDTEEAFRERIESDMEQQFSRESQYKIHIDIKEKLMAETNVPLPEEFLKRWMLLTSKDNSMTVEQLDKNFPSILEDLKWRMIKNKIIGEQKIEATEEEIREQAIWAAQSRFYQYGIYDAPVDQLFRMVDVLLEKEEEKNRLADIILENKAIEHLKTVFGFDEHYVSLEEFKKLMDENKR
jgi:trigger factor